LGDCLALMGLATHVRKKRAVYVPILDQMRMLMHAGRECLLSTSSLSFSVAFKHAVGRTPGTYRRQQRTNA